MKKTLFGLAFIAVIIALVGSGIWSISFLIDEYIKPENQKNESNIEYMKDQANNVAENVSRANEPLKGEEKDKINILILGISGEGYISGELADAIMLASVRPKSKKMDMFSIPRDLWVHDPTQDNFRKINELYKAGGGTENPDAEKAGIIKEKIEEITGQPVHYTVVINLKGTREIIDSVGGLTINGKKFNGEKALDYIRNRNTPRGDFDRMQKQQELIISFLQKLGSEELHKSSPGFLLKNYRTFIKYLSTDMPIVDIIRLGELVTHKIKPEKVGLYPITPFQNNLLYSDYTNVDGFQAYTLHPTAGKEDYSQIEEFISGILNGQ